MKSHSVYSPNPVGLGRLEPIIHQDVYPPAVSGGGSRHYEPVSTGTTPIATPGYIPHPIDDPVVTIRAPKPINTIPAVSDERTFFRIAGETISIGGYQVSKTTAFVAGGGLIGALLLAAILR